MERCFKNANIASLFINSKETFSLSLQLLANIASYCQAHITV